MVIVEHGKRKKEILDIALDVFVEEGYEHATFCKIAARCGLTRTTLYMYFHNKREIFLGCIKQLTDSLYAELLVTLNDKTLDDEVCLRKILLEIVDCVAENSSLFGVLLSYLLLIKKAGIDPKERVRRRIVHLRHILSTVLIRGMDSGIFRPLVIHDANDLFYGLIESAVFRLSLFGRDNIEALRTALRLAVDGILAKRC